MVIELKNSVHLLKAEVVGLRRGLLNGEKEDG
jgi:hypothetical protein